MKTRVSRRFILNRILLYGVAIILALWTLIPIYLIALAAFSSKDAVYLYPKPLLPVNFSTESMDYFLHYSGMLETVMNSIVVAFLTIIASLLLGAPGGYALARFRFRGRQAITLGFLITKMFPVVILAVPLAVVFLQLDLYDTVWAVAIVHTAMAIPFVIIVTSGIFIGVPRELEEAAQTLGCNRLQAFARVVMPLAMPGLAAAGIFTFVMSWNEVFAATILTLLHRTLPAQLMANLTESPAVLPLCGRIFYDRARPDFHLSYPEISVEYVGQHRQMTIQ